MNTKDLDELFEDVGTNWSDFYELHALGSEPDIECIHLTDKAKTALLAYIQRETIKARIDEVENLDEWNWDAHKMLQERREQLHHINKEEL